jgi:AcrR family transcriptional regulator
MSNSITTKEAIERAALRLFVEQGVAETSIKDIARAAGISQGAMYNHYVSKEVLAWGLYSENMSRLGQELRRRAQQQDGLAEKLRAMVEHVYRRFDEDQPAISYIFSIRHQYLRRMTRQVSNPFTIIRSVIADAIVRREIPRQDVDLTTSLVAGAIIQVIDTRIYWHWRADQPLANSSDRVAAACLRLTQI